VTSLLLSGCAPTPLASYLKALGILRIVAEQADHSAAARWADDGFVLSSRLNAPALEALLLEQYRPTPLVAPWGARSGFYPGSSEATARTALERIEACDLERLVPFRETLAVVRGLLQRLGMTEKVRDDAKLDLLRACRAELPDHVLPWLDACYVLTDEGRAFPPLLGTGGNEGSGSYVSGFAQQVVACVVERRHDHALAAALFAVARPSTGSNQTPGQFAPLAAGGANATSGFEGGTILNPWDFILCLEGTLLFAAAASKRLEAASAGALAYPFTVRAVGAGAGSVALGDEANARAETWFPLWDRPTTLAELAAVFAEGRVQVSGRTARDALDFARAVSSLGMQRGITSFQRYGFLQRFGRNVIAVPIERVEVRRNPHGDLIDELERSDWLARFRRLARTRDPVPPARLRSLVSRLENALFDLARIHDPWRVQTVLVRLGEAQAYLGRSRTARDSVPPVPQLSDRWVRAADDGSPEFRIAAALAGLHGPPRDAADRRPSLPMGIHFAPIDERGGWLEGAAPDVKWGPGSLTDNLRALAGRRLLAAQESNLTDAPWLARASAPIAAVAAWLAGDLDEFRIGDLLQGLVLARIPAHLRGSGMERGIIPPAYAVLKPMLTARAQLVRVRLLVDSGDARVQQHATSYLRHAATVLRLLAANRAQEAVDIGVRRMRAQGNAALTSLENMVHPDGRLLLATLLVPLDDADLRRIARRIARHDDERQLTVSLTETEA
jgi:CRISPR-associated protein Csx17